MVGRIRKLYFVSRIWVKDEDGRERHTCKAGAWLQPVPQSPVVALMHTHAMLEEKEEGRQGSILLRTLVFPSKRSHTYAAAKC